MADNVAITAGSGTSIATDDVSGVHFQRIKLVDGTLEGTTGIPGDASGLYTQGGVAHDASDSGRPVKVGGAAQTSLPTAVASGDRVNFIGDQFGRQLVSHIAPGMQTWKSAAYTTTQTGAALWTPAGGKKIAVCYLQVGTVTGNTTNADVTIWFGASGDTTYTAGTDQLVFRGAIAQASSNKPGFIVQGPPLFAATADHILRVTTSAAIHLYICVYGYEF